MIAKTLLVLCLFNSLSRAQVEEEDRSDPGFKAIEEQFLIFPLLEKDYDAWNTMGSAVFLKDSAILTPQVPSRKGLMYTT